VTESGILGSLDAQDHAGKGVGGLFVGDGQDMRIGVQGDTNVCVPEPLGHDLDVMPTGRRSETGARVGMSDVMEAYRREPCGALVPTEPSGESLWIVRLAM